MTQFLDELLEFAASWILGKELVRALRSFRKLNAPLFLQSVEFGLHLPSLSLRIFDVVLELVNLLCIALRPELLLLLIDVVDFVLLLFNEDLSFLELVLGVGGLFFEVRNARLVAGPFLLQRPNQLFVCGFDTLDFLSRRRNLG